jgi:hypothetical protein
MTTPTPPRSLTDELRELAEVPPGPLFGHDLERYEFANRAAELALEHAANEVKHAPCLDGNLADRIADDIRALAAALRGGGR